jgi:anti-sigma factor ChrR (cupin superfamily)
VVHHALEGLDLSRPGEWVDGIRWQRFQPGVEIHRLYGDGLTGPAAALLRFQPGGKIPLHFHTGYEHILVLEGSQEDEHGQLVAGGVRIHPPGSSHSVMSESGCLVLAIYEKAVSFLEGEQGGGSGGGSAAGRREETA